MHLAREVPPHKHLAMQRMIGTHPGQLNFMRLTMHWPQLLVSEEHASDGEANSESISRSISMQEAAPILESLILPSMSSICYSSVGVTNLPAFAAWAFCTASTAAENVKTFNESES